MPLFLTSYYTSSHLQTEISTGNKSKNDMIKNDATSNPEGEQKNVEYKYATLSERWSKLAKVGVIPHRIKRNFRAKRQMSHRKQRCSHSASTLLCATFASCIGRKQGMTCIVTAELLYRRFGRASRSPVALNKKSQGSALLKKSVSL